MIIVPERLTNFNRTQNELELLLIFSVAVAGKTAKTTAQAISRLFDGYDVPETSPMEIVANWFSSGGRARVLERLKQARTGNYNRMLYFLSQLNYNQPDLKTITVKELTEYKGISFKTAHMIILHSRPNQRLAVIDTHVLKFMASKLGLQGLPKSSPSSWNRYEILQEQLLDWVDTRITYEPHICIMHKDVNIGCVTLKRKDDGTPDYAAFDLDLWNVYSGNPANTVHKTKGTV